jgi:hypothetical protein
MISSRLSVLVLIASIAAFAADAPSSPLPSPVLVELFTSEGCSTCPPADKLLQDLDTSQPVPRAQLVVLSEHVDYWNSIGWKDPYSSSLFSERQNAYVEQFGLKSAYTPQMVVDGSEQFSGSNRGSAIQSIEKAAGSRKIPIRISSISMSRPRVLQAHIEADSPSDPATGRTGAVFVAVALNHADSQVLRGENAGHHLTHVAVAQSITKVGTVKPGKPFAKDVEIKLDSKMELANLRVIAFIQDSGSNGGPGQVAGVAMEPATK